MLAVGGVLAPRSMAQAWNSVWHPPGSFWCLVVVDLRVTILATLLYTTSGSTVWISAAGSGAGGW